VTFSLDRVEIATFQLLVYMLYCTDLWCPLHRSKCEDRLQCRELTPLAGQVIDLLAGSPFVLKGGKCLHYCS